MQIGGILLWGGKKPFLCEQGRETLFYAFETGEE